MPNLNLAHSGNMNITSASIEGNQLKVSYEPNNTGAVTGFTFAPPQGTEFVCGETYTITATPKYSGTVLTETFVVSGVDEAGVARNDSSVLRQGYDTDLTHYELNLGSVGATILSSSVTSDYVELVVRIDDDDYAEIDIQPEGGSVITYPIDNISGGEGPDTGTVASSLTIVVADSITGSGIASAIWSPSDAVVSLRYESNSPAYATIDPVTGEITVLQTGDVRFTVFDDITGLFDSKVVHCYKEGEGPDTGDTGTVINFLAISVPAYIWDECTGCVNAQYSPSSAAVDLHYTSNLPSIAEIDERTGDVIVHQTGNVTFCVRDSRSGLSDCMPVNVGISDTGDTGVSATAISINILDTITDEGLATATVEPANADVSLYYTYEDTEIIGANNASIDRYSGQIIVRRTGTARFCVEDLYTGLKDCKVVNVIKSDTPDTGDTWTGGTLVITYSGVEVNRCYQFANDSQAGGGDRYWYFPNLNKVLTGYTESGEMITIDEDGVGCLYDSASIDANGCVTITYPDVTTIPRNAFHQSYDNYNREGAIPTITNVSIGDGIRTIRTGAFADMYYGTINCDLTLPSSVIVGEMSFHNSRFHSLTINGPFYTGRQNESITYYGKVCFNSFGYYLHPQSYYWTFPIFVQTSEIDNYKSTIPEGDETNQYAWQNWILGEAITSLTLSIATEIVDSGVATPVYLPSNGVTSFVFSSSDTNVATIDNYGNIIVLEEGVTTICVEDTYSGLRDCKQITCTKDTGDAYYNQYLTFEILTNGNIVLSRSSGTASLQFSNDSGSTWTESSNYPVSAGDIVYAKGFIGGLGVTINPTCQYNLSGNILSLGYGDNFRTATYGGTFDGLFQNSTTLLNAENLVFHKVYSGTLARMFYNCSNLVKPPKKLPATILQYQNYKGCYEYMFAGCTNLLITPELPATTLQTKCYYYMFYNCASLTTAPELPATMLAESCCESMFNGCSNLVTGPSELPATTLANYCYRYMFSNTSLTSAPELPAPTLTNRCYLGMFADCSNLNYIKCLATDISADSCTGSWLYGVASSGTFIKSPSMSGWATGVSGIPSGWTVRNVS